MSAGQTWVQRRNLWVLCAVYATACNRGQPAIAPVAAVQVAPVVPVAAPNEEAVGTSEWVRELSVAAFAGDTLSTCSTVSVSLDKGKAGNYDGDRFVGGFLAAMAGDHVAAMKGREAALHETDGSFLDGISRFVSMKEDELREATRDQKKVAGISEARKMLQTFLETKWPTERVEREIKQGTLATVPNCSFPDKTVLGSCSIRRGREGLTAFIVSSHYAPSDVVGSDRALKMCLKFGGAWQGLDKNAKHAKRPPQP